MVCKICICEDAQAQAPSPDEWFNHWVSGMNLFQNKNYNEAIAEFSQAINFCEVNAKMDESHVHLYNDRGQALMLSNQHTEAIADFSKVIESQQAPIQQTIRALWGRTTCYGIVEDCENFQLDYEKLKITDPDYPKVEYTNDYVIFRNFNCSALTSHAKSKFCCAMIHLDICKSKEDILFTDTGVCLVKRKCQCGCEKSEKENEYEKENGKSCNCCGEIIMFTPPLAAKNTTNCKYWCDRVAQSAFVMCGGMFKTVTCKLICTGVVETLKEGCHWCCGGSGFYRKCVQPFEDFIKQVPCDPQFD